MNSHRNDQKTVHKYLELMGGSELLHLAQRKNELGEYTAAALQLVATANAMVPAAVDDLAIKLYLELVTNERAEFLKWRAAQKD